MVDVSIIVPVYNTEKYLNKCLNSLVNQTLKNIEILVVNDGSTDNSQKIIDEFTSKYSNVKSFIKENGGLSDARNYAIPHALGEYIGFVDSDDFVDDTMFEKMFNTAKEKNIDLVECNFIWEYPNKSTKDNGTNLLNTSDYFLYGRVMACNKLFKSSILKENNIKFPKGLKYEDVEFYYTLIPYINSHALVKDYFYHYIQRDTSLVNNQNEKTADIFKILNNVLEFYKNHNLYEKYEKELEYLYIRFLMGSSFLRIVKIKDKALRKDLLNKSYLELNNKFPNWKQNELLNIKSKKNTYYKSINKSTYKFYSFIFRFI